MVAVKFEPLLWLGSSERRAGLLCAVLGNLGRCCLACQVFHFAFRKPNQSLPHQGLIPQAMVVSQEPKVIN